MSWPSVRQHNLGSSHQKPGLRLDESKHAFISCFRNSNTKFGIFTSIHATIATFCYNLNLLCCRFSYSSFVLRVIILLKKELYKDQKKNSKQSVLITWLYWWLLLSSAVFSVTFKWHTYHERALVKQIKELTSVGACLMHWSCLKSSKTRNDCVREKDNENLQKIFFETSHSVFFSRNFNTNNWFFCHTVCRFTCIPVFKFKDY